MVKLTIRLKGGAGSGFHGHKGRPGEVGGSAPKGSSPGTPVVMDKGSSKSVISDLENNKLYRAGYSKSAQFYDKQVMLKPVTSRARSRATNYDFPSRLNLIVDKREDGNWHGEINLDGSITDLEYSIPGMAPRLRFENGNLQSLLNDMNTTLTDVAHKMGGTVSRRL
ncbi:MAG: hypothetical protein WC479_00580 [Candidatus Izemoplasmatales bacterium]